MGFTQDFIDFLSHVAEEIDKLVVGKDEVRGRFTEHAQKVLSEADKYGEYLQAEYNKAKKKGYTKHDERPEGKGWYWYSAYGQGTTDHFGGEMVTFWMRGEPKTDPLSFVHSMVLGCVGRLHENLNLLDCQYFLITCIHDAQRWVAGQERIYFDPLDKNDLKNKICQKIWETVTRDSSTLNTLQDIQTTIQTAFQAVSQATPAKPERESWLWKLYEKTLGVIIGAILERWWPK